jgi:Bacterial SH3 domain
MKKVVQFILGLILIHPFNIQAQFRYGFGDSLFVWAATLNLREDADAEAFIKEKIPYGTAVIIVDDSIGRFDFKYKAMTPQTLSDGHKTKPFLLHGFWVKVNFNGITGYVFDGYLSKVKPFFALEKTNTQLDEWAEKTLNLTSSRHEKGDEKWVKYSNVHSEIQINIGHNTKTSFREIILRNFSIEEALMLGIQIFKASYQMPQKNGIFEFKSSIEEPDCEIIFSKEKEKTIIRLSCHC